MSWSTQTLRRFHTQINRDLQVDGSDHKLTIRKKGYAPVTLDMTELGPLIEAFDAYLEGRR